MQSIDVAGVGDVAEPAASSDDGSGPELAADHPGSTNTANSASVRRRRLFLQVLAGAALFGVMLVWCLIRLRNQGGDFDFAYFRQSMWLIAHGQDPYVSFRRIPLFGDHWNVATWLLAQPTRFVPAALWLCLVSCTCMTALAMLVAHLARKLSRREAAYWIAFGVMALQPTLWRRSALSFHPELIILPALAVAVIAAIDRRWWRYGIGVAVALMAKEDVAIAVALVGVVLASVGFGEPRPDHPEANGPTSLRQVWSWCRAQLRVPTRADRIAGGVTIGAAAVVFVSALLVQRHLTGVPVAHPEALQPWGSTIQGALKQMLLHRWTVLYTLAQPDRILYAVGLFVGFAFLPLRRLRFLVPAVPAFALNMLCGITLMRNVQFQYSLVPFCFAALAFAAAVVEVTTLRRYVALAAGVFVAFMAYSAISPLSEPWALTVKNPVATQLEAAAKVVPRDAPVSVWQGAYDVFADRADVYEFPEPFSPTGADNITPRWMSDRVGLARRQADTHWVVVFEPQIPNPLQRAAYAALRSAPGVQERFRTPDGVVVYYIADPSALPPLLRSTSKTNQTP